MLIYKIRHCILWVVPYLVHWKHRNFLSSSEADVKSANKFLSMNYINIRNCVPLRLHWVFKYSVGLARRMHCLRPCSYGCKSGTQNRQTLSYFEVLSG